MLKRISLICLSVLLMFASTSCWDYMEIEDKAFIIGLAVDKAGDEEIEVTFQVAEPKAFTPSGESEEVFWNVSEVAIDLTRAHIQLAKRMNQVPSLEHCQVILIGEELAKIEQNENLDFLLRTHDIRRNVHVGVVQGKAKDIFDIDFKGSLIPAFVISEMMNQNHNYSLEITNYMDIGSLHVAETNNFDYILPKLVIDEDKLDMSGGGVFKDMHLIGWLDGVDLMGLRFLRGDIGSGYLAVELPEELGKRAMMKVFEATSSMEPEIEDGRLIAKLDLRIEGDMTEIVRGKEEIDETEFLCRLEELYEQDVKNKIEKSFRKMQQEFNSDPYQLKEKLMNYYPKFWKENQENWDEIYRSATLELDVKVLIRRIGEIKH
ncbi:MAG: Ger(x)C family spore germination protein [Clostridiales bacterium]|nr:Ger(x)C family spore germination protein [Clostridiales bacterium]